MDTPEGWTPPHSVAALLVGMSMIDGDVDEQEMRALVQVLRGFPGVKGEAARIGQAAYTYLWELQDADGDLIGTLRHHAGVLALHYDAATLESIHERLVDMAEADGEVHPMERRLLTAFRYAWSLGSEA